MYLGKYLVKDGVAEEVGLLYLFDPNRGWTVAVVVVYLGLEVLGLPATLLGTFKITGDPNSRPETQTRSIRRNFYVSNIRASYLPYQVFHFYIHVPHYHRYL